MAQAGKQLRIKDQRLFDKALAARIRNVVEIGKRQELAVEMGLSYHMIQKYLGGESSLSVYRLLQLSEILGKNIDYWLEDLKW